MAGSENCRQNVGAAKCWQWRAIENCEEEKPQCSQVAEHRGQSVPPIPSGILDEGVQHGRRNMLRMELLRANVLSPAYLTHAEDNFYRGESWQSPDTVPMTDEQMKEMKLKRQPDQKAISG